MHLLFGMVELVGGTTSSLNPTLDPNRGSEERERPRVGPAGVGG